MAKIDINNEVLQLEATERLESSLRTVNNLISMLNDMVIPESFEEKDKIELIKSNLNTYSNNLNSTYNLIKDINNELDALSAGSDNLVSSLPEATMKKRSSIL